MAQTKQMTMYIEGEKVVLKARRLSMFASCIRYSVSVNDWRFRVGVKLGELDSPSSAEGMADQALWLAIAKGLAKWLDAK